MDKQVKILDGIKIVDFNTGFYGSVLHSDTG